MNKRAFGTGRSTCVSAVAGSILLSMVAAGCATPNTLAQDLAWERWRKCEGVGTTGLQEIRPDGQIWFWYKSPSEYTLVKECLAKAAAEQAERGRAVAQPVARDLPPAVTGPVMPPVWERGYEWAFRWESPRGKGTFVWSVDREETAEGVSYYVVKSGRTREIYWRKSDLAYYMDRVDGVVETRHVPPEMRYAWPLTRGKTWETRYTVEKSRDRQTTEMSKACQVEGEESITVPAGTFRTLKIVCRNQRTGSIREETWYSPDVLQWIRERGHFSYGIRERELVAFKLKGRLSAG